MVNLSLLDFARAVQHHANGEWGHVGIRGRRANSRALKIGGAVRSEFSTHNGISFCVVTNEDRSSTSIMLKAEKTLLITFKLIGSSCP
jgi:hypothetical protein